MRIIGSASKIVFIMLALAACIALFTGNLDNKDFMILAMAAFTHYFKHSQNGGQSESGRSPQ